MKKSFIIITLLGTFLATSCTKTKTADKSTSTDRGSTQRIGQSGSNGTGEGIKHNMLNGTGDGLQNAQWKTYSQQLEEKGLLASKAGAHGGHESFSDTTHQNKAPSEAEAEVEVLKQH